MKKLAVVVCCLVVAVLAACSGPAGSPEETPIASPYPREPEGPLVFEDTIAYVSDAPGNYEVFVLSPDSQPVRLTESDEDEGRPVWSPDGSTIAFGRREADGTIDVWTMDADGGSQRRIYDSGSVYLDGLAWHPNGETLYLSRGYFDGPRDMARRVIAVSAQGAETQSGIWVEGLWDQHFTYTGPDVTRDGAMVVFVHYEGYVMPFLQDIYSGELAADGLSVHRIVQLTEKEGIDRNPVWSPDGTAIAWESETEKNSDSFNIWVMDADGSARRQVTSGPGRQVNAAWSSAGLALIYVSDEGGSSQLYTRYVWDGEEVLQLTEGEGNSLHPDVRPAR
jgi:Tol biopolymer transport system component